MAKKRAKKHPGKRASATDSTPSAAKGKRAKPPAKDRPAKPATPEVATSLRDLGRKMGRSFISVREWTLRPDWPFGKAPKCWPLKVADVIAWTESHLVRDAASGGGPAGGEPSGESGPLPIGEIDPLKRLRILKLEQEVEKLRSVNDQLRSRLIDRADAQAELAGYLANWRTAIVSEARSLIDALDAAGGISPDWHDRAAHLAEERAEALCRRFANEMIEHVRRAE